MITFNEEHQVNFQSKRYGKFPCPECGKIIQGSHGLKTHIMSHTGERPSQCLQCKKAFKFPSGLKYHMRLHTKENLLNCEHCNKSFTMVGSLKEHQSSQTFHCVECRKCFTERALAKHKKFQHAETPLPCEHCQKTFKTRQSRNSHVKLHVKTLSCPQCEARFTYQWQLKKHDFVHTKEGVFNCNTCEKSFQTKTNLDIHTRNHTGETPYPCSLCDKSFKGAFHLKNHQLVHLSNGEIYLYKCDLCQYETKRKSQLYRHKEADHKANIKCSHQSINQCLFVNNNPTDFPRTKAYNRATVLIHAKYYDSYIC